MPTEVIPRGYTRLLKVSQIAERCGVSQITVERWIKNRKETNFPRRVKVSNTRLLRFKEADIEKWMSGLAVVE